MAHDTCHMTHGTCYNALSTEVEILKNIFPQDADADGSGSVDFSEFVGLMIKVMYFDMHLYQIVLEGAGERDSRRLKASIQSLWQGEKWKWKKAESENVDCRNPCTEIK